MNLFKSLVTAAILIFSTTVFASDGIIEGTLKSDQVVRISVPGYAKKELNIRVRGSGGDLDCYLYHSKESGMAIGKFVGRDDSFKDGCDLHVTPEKDETYTLLVENASAHDEHYAVTSH